MPHSAMTIKELFRCAEDSDSSLVKALVSMLDELADEIGILSVSDKEVKKQSRSDFDEQLEYVKRLVGLDNTY